VQEEIRGDLTTAQRTVLSWPRIASSFEEWQTAAMAHQDKLLSESRG
jgi:hypothetical protein